MGVAELREDVIEAARELEARGKLESVVLSGVGVYSTATAVGVFANSATPMLLEEALRQLNDQYARAHAAEGRDAKYAEEDERKAAARAPLTDEEQAAIDADNERVRELAEAENSTERRLERIEGLLGRIAVAMEKR